MNKEVRRMQESSIDAMYDLVIYAFNSERTDKRRRRFEQIAEHSLNYGFFMDNQLTSQVMATPFRVNFHEVSYKMAGIGYVASYPEYRGEGGISSIMKTMLAELAEQGFALSYLAPFSYPFYRKYGYEQIFEQAEYTIKAIDWPYIKRVPGRIQRVDWQTGKATIAAIYQQVKKTQRGGLAREDWWFDYALNRNEADHLAIYTAPTGEAAGYLKYRMENGIFEIVEWHYLTNQAFKALAGFIGSHTGSVNEFHWVTGFAGQDLNYLLPTPAAQVTILPYMMARIVNLATFIAEYPFKAGKKATFYLAVEDEYGPWNQGIWQLNLAQDGNKTFEKLSEVPENEVLIKGSIQTWTQLLMGYRSSEELAFHERLTGEQTQIGELGSRLVVGQPILEDYF